VRLYCPHVLAGAMTDMEIREVQLDTSADEKRVEELNAELASLPVAEDKVEQAPTQGLYTDLDHIME
jgi:hypothetical protein